MLTRIPILSGCYRSAGDIGSRTRRRRLTGNRTLSMCRSSYQPLRSGSASEAILCSGVVRRGLGRRVCTGTHESGRAPRRRLAPGPQPGPPCPTTTALRPLRRRPAPTSFASVGCWLLSSPVTHRAITVRLVACKTLASPPPPAASAFPCAATRGTLAPCPLSLGMARANAPERVHSQSIGPGRSLPPYRPHSVTRDL